MEGTEAEKWGKLSAAEKEAALYKFDKPVKEKKITQEMRQIAFDNYETTDDHGMVIVGTAVDQQGNPFFKVKTRGTYVSLRRLLLLLASVRGVQNPVDHGEQKRRSAGDPQQTRN